MPKSKRTGIAKGKLDFDHLGIGTALSRNRLKVPVNQREYKWKDEHVLDLLRDFTKAIRNQESSYFLGTIVLTGGEDGPPEIADGQQRLATTTILLAAIRDWMHKHDEEMLVRSIEDGFLFKILRDKKTEEPRLTLNVDDNEFFKNRILKRPDDPARKIEPTKLSHRRINAAANLAAKHINEVLKPLPEGEKVPALNEWIDFIEESAQVILLKVPDDLNAFVMFETLNDRGLKTSQADLVKNYLYSEAGERISEAQQQWAVTTSLLESTDDDDIVLTYLRHLMSALYGLTREREVFERIKDNNAGQGPVMRFLHTLAQFAIEYGAILNPDHVKWNEYKPSIRHYIRILNTLQVQQIRPLLLVVAKKFSKQETEKAFHLFVSWTVRFLIAGGGRGGRLEEAYAQRAKDVTDGKINNTKELALKMGTVVPTDAEFEAAFSTAIVSKSHLARYYLRALERCVKNEPEPELIPNDDPVINLEHILPEIPGPAWYHIEPEVAAAIYRRLGNMVLIQATKNSMIGNSDFVKAKRPVLGASAYILTSETAQNEIWGIDQISDRQKRLAKLAVKTWPIDVW